MAYDINQRTCKGTLQRQLLRFRSETEGFVVHHTYDVPAPSALGPLQERWLLESLAMLLILTLKTKMPTA